MEQASKEPRGTVTFACGGKIAHVVNPEPVAAHKDRDGRVRLVIFNSEDQPMRPQIDGRGAPCLSCPCRGKAKRKQWRCFPGDYEQREAEYAGKMVWVYVVTCYGKWAPDHEVTGA
jgi:hypothetical protein